MMKNFIRHMSVICMFTLLCTMLLTGCGSSTTGESAANENESEALSVIELTQEPSTSKITTLMNTYFTALKKGDVSALSEIMVNAPSKDTVKSEIQYVEDYWNVDCYTTPGVEDNTWVAYVYYNVKFNNIETAAPSMIREYICTNKDGNLYINNGTVDSEVSAWLESVQNSSSVADLLNTVNSELQDAASEDEDLATLIKALGDETANSEETESAASEDTQAAESTEEETTQAVESTEEETTKAEESQAEETTKKASTKKKTTKKTTTAYKKYKKSKKMYTMDITNVRKAATTSSKILGRLNEGKKVTALGTKNGFIAIKYGSKTGYIKSDLLTSKKPKKTITFRSKDDQVEALINVKLRKKPSTSAKSAGILPAETVVKRTGYNSHWTRIRYKGKTYYVATEYVKKY